MTAHGRPRRTLARALAIVVLAILAPAAGAAEGDLDPSFAGDGRLALPAAGSFVGRAVSVDRRDRIVVAGYRCEPSTPDDGTCLAGGNTNVRLTRLLPDGGLDAEFGDTGFVTTQLGEGRSQALDVLVQRNGRIVVAGLARVGGRDVFALARYTAQGALDPGFGTGGVALIAVGSAYASIADVEPGPNGTLLVAGQAVDAAGVPRIAVARITTRGALDPRFGTGGVTLAGRSRYGYGLGLAVAPDGDPVVAGIAGDSDAPGTFRFAQVRVGSAGTRPVVTQRRVGRTSSFANGLAVLRDGSLLAAGAGTVANGHQAVATVLQRPDGRTRARLFALGGGAVANDVLPDPGTGGAFLAGQVLHGGGYDFAVQRVDAAGALRRASEVSWPDFPVARATAAALQRSGRLVTVGLGCAGGVGVRCSAGTPVLLVTRQLAAAPPVAAPVVRVARRVSRRRLRRGLRVEVRLRRAARVVVRLEAHGRLVRRTRTAHARRRHVLRMRARVRRGPMRLVVRAGPSSVTRKLRLRG